MKRLFSYMVGNSQDNQVVVDKEMEMGPMPGGGASSVAAGMVASSSSSSSARRCKYDVFLSFRGLDTRKGITAQIRDRLRRSGIITFMDEPDLKVGDTISPTLIKAIKESRFAIVILSQNYASSAWCLEELREICLSMEDNRILPLFYHVDPTEVRYQKKGSFKEAFSKHETSGRHKPETVEEWRAALEKVANISGWNTNDFKTHEELVDNIVEYLCSKVPLDPIESTGDFQPYEATKEAMRKVMEALRDDKITAVGVYGMGGVGKTSMVRHVAAQARKNGTFNRWIIAVVSQIFDLKKIQGTLADLLGFKFEEETEDGRAAKLHKEIMGKEKLLIILDDVWHEIKLSKIGIPDYNELQTCNSKVLVTTRKSDVLQAMKCTAKHGQVSITLNILSDEDALALFRRNAGRFESTTFEEVAKRVAGECKGLPIALITVAKALGDKELKEWEKAALQLEKSQSANPNHDEDDENAFKCIRLSYDYLKNEDHNSCFLLCCMFPEDHEIKIEDLFRYTIGKRLFRDAETREEARGRVVTVVKYLKNSSLLLDSEKEGCVKMHDVIRDTAIQIAKSEDGHRFLVKAGCGLDDWPSRLDEGCTAISLMHNRIRELPPHLVCPKLQILSLSHNDELRVIPETFFQTLNELRVLDLSWTGISYLPESFGLLTNLRAVYLDNSPYLWDISVVGKITTLEVLSVKGARLWQGLPREIGNLTNLRVLDITEGIIDKIPSKLLSKLHSLEELYLPMMGDWGSKVDGEGDETNSAFDEVTGFDEVDGEGDETNSAFDEVTGFDEVDGEGDETNSAFDEVTGLSKLRILHVWIYNEECIPKLVERNPNWVGFFICIGQFEERLSDFCKSDQKTIFLKLDSISNFPDWFFNTVINKAEKLCWYDCPRTGLIDVFVEYERGRLHSLKQLELYGMDDEDDLYGKDDEDDVMNTSTWVPKEPLFENLEELYLGRLDCAELCAVEFLQPGSLCNLKLLNIESCYNRGNVLLPSKLLARLLNLEELECSSMDEIEYVFGYEALLETEQSKLRKIVLSDLETVRSLCEGPAPPAIFQNLQYLSIENCEQLQGSLFTYDVAQCLSQLNFLDLTGCPLLDRIVEASNKKIILRKLKHLILWQLPVLYYESATFDIECPSLEELELWDCPQFSVSVPDFHSRKQIQLKLLD